MEIEFMQQRKRALEDSFDKYMEEALEKEKIAANTIAILVNEALGSWCNPEDIDLENKVNYVLKEKDKENTLELGEWDQKQLLFWVEDRGVFLDPERVLCLI